MNRLALFDLDGTLTDRDTIFDTWATDFAVLHGLTAEATGLLVELDADGYGDKRAMFATVAARFGLDLDIDATIAAFYADLAARHRVTPWVRESLRVLRGAGWRAGIITNGTSAQLEKIAASGLDAMVDGVTVSDIEGIRKPDPRLFTIAARRAGSPEATGGWMVGDNPQADILGGANAAMITAWVARGRPWPHDQRDPDHQVNGVPHAVRLMLSGDATIVPLERQAVRAIVTDGAGRVLLLEVEDPSHPDRGRWLSTPGGGKESGESDHDALHRELLEETGIDKATVADHVLDFTAHTSHIGYPIIQHNRVYHLRTDPNRTRREPSVDYESDTHKSIRWWTLDELETDTGLLDGEQRFALLSLLRAESG